MSASVFDVVSKDILEWVDSSKSQLLYGHCSNWDDYVRHSERVRTTERVLEIIKDALKRLEDIENG